jgi:hypothetical protein
VPWPSAYAAKVMASGRSDALAFAELEPPVHGAYPNEGVVVASRAFHIALCFRRISVSRFNGWPMHLMQAGFNEIHFLSARGLERPSEDLNELY